MIEFFEDRRKWAAEFVPQKFRGFGWSNFRADTEKRQEIVSLVQGYRDDLLAGSRSPLVLYGGTNTGKTLLASLVLMDVAEHVNDRLKADDAAAMGTADNVVWANGADVQEIVKRGNGRHTGFAVTPAHLATAYLGVIDDIDECEPGWLTSSLYKILNDRLWANRLPTIITMNATPKQFVKKYGDSGMPMWSRMERSGALVIRVDKEVSAG